MTVLKGIRYARAGRLGFPVEEPLPDNLSDLQCSSEICPQKLSILGSSVSEDGSEAVMSEDCLRLSIFTPDRNPDEALDGASAMLPVLVWVPGGAFCKGSGEFVRYDASDLAREENVVIVNISYRVGAFGFLHGSSNPGLEDIRCALRWVQHNISRFGGNNEDVTICGQSAGALCIANLICSCREHLFDKAILFSPPLGLKPTSFRTAGIRRRIEKYLKRESYDLQSASTEQILQAQDYALSGNHASAMPFCTEDIPRFPLCRKTIPGLSKVLITSQKNDASPFVPGRLEPLATSFLFTLPARLFAHLLRRRGVNARWLQFSWAPENNGSLKACHTLEVSLLLGSWQAWNRSDMLKGVTEEEYLSRSRSLKSEIAAWIRS